MPESSEVTAISVGSDAMPAVGLGLWKLGEHEAAEMVVAAAEAGYRHFDAASDYGNESAVGRGLRDVQTRRIASRHEIWVTSKLWNCYHRPEHVSLAAKRSLSDLGLDYFDLYLIHFPIATRFVPFEERYPPGWFFDPGATSPRMEFDRVGLAETWGAMEALVADGLARHIGVCNFGTALLRDMLNYAERRPEVLQVELHPLLTQDKLLRFCREEGIAVTAFSPLGSPSYVPLGMASEGESVLDSPAIAQIAAAHGKTPAQVVLRWGVQRGTAVIPKTSWPARLAENLALFDFQLADQEMRTIAGLNRNRRFNDPGVFAEAAFNTFCPIYE